MNCPSFPQALIAGAWPPGQWSAMADRPPRSGRAAVDAAAARGTLSRRGMTAAYCHRCRVPGERDLICVPWRFVARRAPGGPGTSLDRVMSSPLAASTIDPDEHLRPAHNFRYGGVSMNEHPNAVIVRSAYEAFANGDGAALAALLDDGCLLYTSPSPRD